MEFRPRNYSAEAQSHAVARVQADDHPLSAPPSAPDLQVCTRLGFQLLFLSCWLRKCTRVILSSFRHQNLRFYDSERAVTVLFFC